MIRAFAVITWLMHPAPTAVDEFNRFSIASPFTFADEAACQARLPDIAASKAIQELKAILVTNWPRQYELAFACKPDNDGALRVNTLATERSPEPALLRRVTVLLAVYDGLIINDERLVAVFDTHAHCMEYLHAHPKIYPQACVEMPVLEV